MRDEQAYEWLDAHFERLNTKKRLHTAWWLPGQGVAVNLPMTGGLQLWRYTTLPVMVPMDRVYREAKDDDPAGILWRPSWQILRNASGDSGIPIMRESLELILGYVEGYHTTGQIQAWEFDAIEKQSGVPVPEAIRQKYIKDSPKVAKRRWGVNRLKIRTNFIPFDGSKKLELNSWGEIRR